MNRRTIVCAPEFPEGASGSGEPSEIERRADAIIKKDTGFPGISAEREREILGGCCVKPSVYLDESKFGLDNKMREFSDLQNKLNSVGSPDFDQSTFYNVLHRITDFIGITSPEKRYRKIERQIANNLNTNLNTVCRMVEDSRHISKNLDEYITVQKNNFQAADEIFNAYQEQESQLKNKLKDTAIPEEERDKLKQDLGEVCNVQISAAKAVVLCKQYLIFSEFTKSAHEKFIPVLEKLKERLYSKLDSIKPDSLCHSGNYGQG
jgi:hypothetical protein